jgi:hypothetical protein
VREIRTLTPGPSPKGELTQGCPPHTQGILAPRNRLLQHRSAMSLMHLLRSRFLPLLTLLCATSAFASSKDRAPKESKDKLAKTACLSGDYAKGVALLAELYVSTNDIAYLFNQGRCFEQNGKYEEAIVRFREFQRKNADAGNPPDAAAEKHIADCQDLLDKAKPATPVPPTPAAVPGASPMPAVPLTTAPVVEPAAPVSTPEAAKQPEGTVAASTGGDQGAGLRIAGIVTFAVGVAGVATALGLNLKANSLASDLNGSASTMNSSSTLYTRSKESSRSTYETLSWVGYGVGGACLAAGAILYYLGHSRAAGHASVALLPAAGPGQVGAVVQGAF